MTLIEERDTDARTGWIRLAMGLGQGLAAWLLIENADSAFAKGSPGLFAALAFVVAFPPLIVLASIGRMRLRTLAIWTLTAAALLVALAFYDIWREPIEAYRTEARVWPSPQLIGFAAIGLFIAHHLIEPADVERRLLASYQERFETAWRHGFQLALSVAFTLVFWGVLHLGALLFDMIGIKALSTLLRQTWFVSPATGAAFAAAVHLTDVRPALIRGVRTVGLALLSWLLPLMAGLTAAFLAALVFTGLEPLWTKLPASASLLGAAATLIILINAVYQDGLEPQTRPPVLRWAVRGASLLLVPLVMLAVWASGLRIAQYGLTPERIAGVAVLIVAVHYAGGYAWAALAKGPWMKRLETVNVSSALTMLLLLLLLFSPVADPARLSVADQVGRLQRGKTALAEFDFDFLRFNAARFGREALDDLARSKDPAIAKSAAQARSRTERQARAQRVDDAGPAFAKAVVLPAGAVLPPDFRAQTFKSDADNCLIGGGACQLFVIDVTGDGQAEVLVAPVVPPDGVYAVNGERRSISALAVYAKGPDGWASIGRYDNVHCAGVAEALRSGQMRATPSPVLDLEVGGQRLSFMDSGGCERAAPQPPPDRRPPPPSELGPAFSRP
jgi:hypothetical protein